MSFESATVYVIDDDASVRDAMAWLLRSRRLLSETYDSAEAFQAVHGATVPDAPGCILLDVRMPGHSGLALFERLCERGIAHAWPVIFLTGHADVPTAVETVKRGAFDFCEKPFSPPPLVDRVEQALAVSRERVVSPALQLYAATATSASTGAARDVSKVLR